MEKYKKYPIERGDSLDIISKKLKIPSAELKYYHNLNSSVKNFITGNQLPKGLTHIILPKHYQGEVPPPQFSYIDEHIYKTIGITHKKYIVIQKILNEAGLENSLHFEVVITENITQDQRSIIIDRKKVWLNNEEISHTVESIYEQAGNSIYPLEIIINNDGSFFSIINTEEIRERWINQRSNLEEYYKGELSIHILKHFDHFFQDIKQFQEMLTNDIFYKIFLMPIYRYYPDEKSISANYTFMLFPYEEEILYNLVFSPDTKISRSGKFCIGLTGSYIDRKEANHNIISEVQGNIDILYKLHANDKRISEIYGYLQLNTGKALRRIEIEIIEQLE